MRIARWIGIGFLAAVAIYFALYVWPTPYREYRISERVVRVNRVTGSMQVLTAHGWQ